MMRNTILFIALCFAVVAANKTSHIMVRRLDIKATGTKAPKVTNTPKATKATKPPEETKTPKATKAPKGSTKAPKSTKVPKGSTKAPKSSSKVPKGSTQAPTSVEPFPAPQDPIADDTPDQSSSATFYFGVTATLMYGAALSFSLM
jgi:hypothetical protein